MGPGQGARVASGYRLLATGGVVLLLYAYSVPTRAAVFAIDEYRAHVSLHLHGIVQCRFTPTCSWYGHEAIRKYGFAKGTVKTVGRIARCGPWTKLGTRDEP